MKKKSINSNRKIYGEFHPKPQIKTKTSLKNENNFISVRNNYLANRKTPFRSGLKYHFFYMSLVYFGQKSHCIKKKKEKRKCDVRSLLGAFEKVLPHFSGRAFGSDLFFLFLWALLIMTMRPRATVDISDTA